MQELLHPDDRDFYRRLGVRDLFGHVFEPGTPNDQGDDSVQAYTWAGEEIPFEAATDEEWDDLEQSAYSDDFALNARLHEAAEGWILANAPRQHTRLLTALSANCLEVMREVWMNPVRQSQETGARIFARLPDFSFGNRTDAEGLTYPFIAIHTTLAEKAEVNPLNAVAQTAQAMLLASTSTYLYQRGFRMDTLANQTQWMYGMAIDIALSSDPALVLNELDTIIYGVYMSGDFPRPGVPLRVDYDAMKGSDDPGVRGQLLD